MSESKHLIDLHVHSNHSDGLDSPEALVKRARAKGISAIALTDHDSMEGVTEARNAGRHFSVEVVPGVEISSTFEVYSDLHIVGLFIDITFAPLLQELRRLRESREDRAQEILYKINVELTRRGASRLLRRSDLPHARGAVGRPHVASALLQLGYAKDRQEAFTAFLDRNDVPKKYLPLDKATELIHGAGGLAILAHPLEFLRYSSRALRAKSPGQLRNAVRELCRRCREYGCDGVEVFHPRNTHDDNVLLRHIADEFGMLISGGSDYHGEEPWHQMFSEIDPNMIPEYVLRNLKAAKRQMPSEASIPGTEGTRIRFTVRCSQTDLSSARADVNRLLRTDQQAPPSGLSVALEEPMPYGIGEVAIVVIIHILSAAIYEEVVAPALAKLRRLYQLDIDENPFSQPSVHEHDQKCQQRTTPTSPSVREQAPQPDLGAASI